MSYTEDFQGVGGQTARAEHVKSELEAIETAFGAVQTELDAAIKAPDGETLARLDAAGVRALKFLRFNASGEPEAITAAMDWKGDWAAATDYKVGEVVRAPLSHNLSIYIATTAHTSGATFSATNWDLAINLQGLNLEKYDTIKTASFTAVKGESYLLDSAATGSNITVTLPASPALGDSPINLLHVNGDVTVAGQKVFVDGNGNNIMDDPANLTMDINDFSARFIWAGSTFQWRVRTV